jgi:hypothetical protein
MPLTRDDIFYEMNMTKIRASKKDPFPRDYRHAQACPAYFATPANIRAYIKVRRDMLLHGVPTPDVAREQRIVAETRLADNAKKFPLDFSGNDFHPMYFGTRAEMLAYIEIRRRLCDE